MNQAPQFVQQPTNPYYEAASKDLDNIDLTSGVIQNYGQAANALKESGNEMFGANTSPEMREKVMNSRMFSLNLDKGRDLSNAKQNEINTKFAGKMSLGGATAPISYNPGGTMTQKTPFDWGGLLTAGLGAAGQVGAAAMTGGASAGVGAAAM